MKEHNLFNRPLTWIVFVLLSLAGIFYIYHNFDKANSLVNVEIKMDREAALEKAARLASDFEIGPQEFKQTAAFSNDNRFQNFVELEGGGLDTFTELVSEGFYESYHWSVRHFKEQDAREVIFWFKPNGDSYGFYEKVPESEIGATLNQEEALRVAEHHAIYNWDVILDFYELVEKSFEEQISGRIDHSFEYERTDKTVGEGKFRLKLMVSGDKLTSVNYHVKIPEDFDRRYSEMRSANETIQMISLAAISLIYGLLGIILGIFILIRKRRLIWKPAVMWGLGIGFASVFLLTINSLPFSWFSYDTSMSQSNFLLRQLLNGLMGALGFGALIAISFMAAEGLGRMAFPRHIQWWKIWSKNTGGSLPVLGQTISGYLFAIIILAIDVLFYVTTTTHFGWWSPAGTLSDPNILANYLPWLDSIAISLQAGFWEEALFRAVPIAGIFILTKGKKSRNLWIILVLILQTLIFGAGHANYAQQPSYARVIEMVIPFVIMGIIYIYYGILPAVIAHYAVDVFWISLPLWVASTSGIWIDRALVVLFLFAPVFIVLLFRFKNKKWTEVPEKERNSGWLVPKKPIIDEAPEIEIQVKKLKVEKWMLPLGIIGLIIWLLFTPFKTDSPILELSRKDAVEVAKSELTKKYDLEIDEWTVLSSVADKIDIRDIFAWQVGGEEIYNQLFSNFLAPPHWEIRLVKTKGKVEDKTEEFIVRVLDTGKIMGVFHKIPETWSGKNLEQNEAQIIADSTLLSFYSLNRESLKEISVSPTKQENRTDWEFIYADTTRFPLSQGQGRYLIEISGNELINTFSFVHIPEEWTRNYKDEDSKKSIIKTIGNILIVGTIIFGLLIGIFRWTRKKFNLKVFSIVTLLFGMFYILDLWINWNSLLSGYNTQVPMGNFITTMLIGISISGIFFSLFNGVFIAASPGWLPVTGKSGKWDILQAAGLGILVAGTLSAAQSIMPEMEPSWLSFSYLNGIVPWLGIAFSKTMNIIFYPAFAAILFLGIHHFTKSWTTQKWSGIIFALLAGLALMGMSFEDYSTWLISGSILAAFVLLVYFFFIRFHFEWIPISFGILPIISMIKEMIIVKNTTVILGGILMILISLSILYWWYKLLLKYSAQKR